MITLTYSSDYREWANIASGPKGATEASVKLNLDATTDDVVFAMATLVINAGHDWHNVVQAMRDQADDLEQRISGVFPEFQG